MQLTELQKEKKKNTTVKSEELKTSVNRLQFLSNINYLKYTFC